MNIIDVNADNVDKTGFFCYMSKKKTEGYRRKLAWLKDRFDEGMRLKMLDVKEGGRGFIEYIPDEYAWRSVDAAGFMFIHCLWVVGKSKGKGYGELLLNECIEDAKKSGMKGVAMLTSEKVWLAKKRFFEQQGFECAQQEGPFSLMVKHFGDDPAPTLTGGWEKKAARFGDGLTVLYSDQCPYIPDAVETVKIFAENRDIPFSSVLLKNAVDVREKTPSPYGIFSIVRDGELLSYHYLLEKDLNKLYE